LAGPADRGTACLEIELAGDVEEGIAERFGVEAPAVVSPKQAIVGILGIVALGNLIAQPIDGGQHNFAMQFLE
jgi:hypothetical protein